MKILIPKSSLAISLIAPLALQWTTNLGENPLAYMYVIKSDLHNALVNLQQNKALDFTDHESILLFISLFVSNSGGLDVSSRIISKTARSYLIETAFSVPEVEYSHCTYNNIRLDYHSGVPYSEK